MCKILLESPFSASFGSFLAKSMTLDGNLKRNKKVFIYHPEKTDDGLQRYMYKSVMFFGVCIDRLELWYGFPWTHHGINQITCSVFCCLKSLSISYVLCGRFVGASQNPAGGGWLLLTNTGRSLGTNLQLCSFFTQTKETLTRVWNFFCPDLSGNLHKTVWQLVSAIYPSIVSPF